MKRILGIIVVAMMSLLAIGAAGAQDFPAGTLTVDGSGQAAGAPDIAFVQLGVQTSDADVTVAYNAANETIQAVIDALVEWGIDRADIQTMGLSLYQDTPFDPATGMPGEDSIYRANNSVNVTVRDIARVGEVINTGVEAGANNINGLIFGLSDPSALEQEAREAAVADARARAEQLATLMGVELGSPTIIVESNAFQPPRPFGGGNFAMAQSDNAIEEGQLSVSVQVRVTFDIQ